MAGTGRVGGSPHWMFLCGVTACLVSQTPSQSAPATQSWDLLCAHVLPGSLPREQAVLDAAETSSYRSVQLITLKDKCALLRQIRPSSS